ncbi:hypothetical protein VCR15J2_390106 [Vibrio coralliirubri]|uniref:hypothetical protein n=1 Tax=Vibrio coralliirubri TaxID=1516159 RepID=UPI00062F9C0F|nr:hypothetical protein [Vibrio coralliirubri]CDT53844.1 hypothetical protein VCR15J2_390106 [Vibrio coralliirubri]
MKFLKDIPDILNHPHFSFLEKSELYSMPIRFIDEEALCSLYIEGKTEIGVDESGSLVKHIVACMSLASFLGLCEVPRIDTFIVGN